jgi:apolipoprotein N-acyltransferase
MFAGAGAGILFALGNPPFSVPLLCVFALAPLAYLATRSRSGKEALIGGFLAGGIALGVESYFIFHAFAWPSTSSEAFLRFLHWSPVLWSALTGLLFGGGLLLYRRIRSNNALMNAGVLASLYLGFESAVQFVTGHYYLGSFSFDAANIPGAFALASLGGEAFVSFCVAFVGAYMGEWFAAPSSARSRSLARFALLAGCVAGAAFAHEAWLSHAGPADELRVAAVQTGPRAQASFARLYNGEITFNQLSAALSDAARGGADLILYPFAVINGALYAGTLPSQSYGSLAFAPQASVDEWMREHAPASSTVVTWDISYENGRYYQNYDFWSGGSRAAQYRKRFPYAFAEYTPAFGHFGFGPAPAPITPGDKPGIVTLPSGLAASNLQCSEIHLASVARGDARAAQFFLNIGFEWILPGSWGEEYSLAAARYRAAENNIPAVRSSIDGPSALIDRRGNIVAKISADEENTLIGTLSVPKAHRPTLYSVFGQMPLYIGICALLTYARFRALRRSKSPDIPG